MFINYLKKKFGIGNREVPLTEAFHSPLRISLYSTIKLETVDLLVLQSALHPDFVIPNGDLEVLAIGKFDMDGTPIHQIYSRDQAGEEFILQIVEGKDYRSQEPIVDEITLFKQVVTLEPETENSVNQQLATIGFQVLVVNDVTYHRIWGDAYTEKADFRIYDEAVITPAGVENYTNQWLLYGREIESPVGGGSINEYLLVGIEENESTAQIMMQVGLALNRTDVLVQ